MDRCKPKTIVKFLKIGLCPYLNVFWAKKIQTLVNGVLKHNFAISNGGFYFYEEDKMFKIKNQIISLIEDDQLSKSIGKNARKFVIENFSIEKILADYQYKLSSLK